MARAPKASAKRRARLPSWALSFGAAVSVAALGATAHAEGESYPGPFDRLGGNVADAYWGDGLAAAFHLGALASTPVLVLSDADYHVQRTFSRHPAWGEAAWPAVAGGTALPLVLPAALLGVGYAARDPDLVGGGWAALQASGMALVTVTLLKAITGRPPPHPELSDDMRRHSRRFRFGLLRGGVFWGWPSGHAMTNTAMSAALAAYYLDEPAVVAGAYAWACYVTLGVFSFREGRMHWLSDAVAGALIGQAIGWGVGRGFRDQREAEELANTQSQPLSLQPVLLRVGFVLD